MSEDENKKAGHEEDKDEVEAHRNKLAATDEPESDESDKDDDVEAHRHGGKMV